MAGLNLKPLAVAVTILSAAGSVAALANGRCGYDRYGYHPPDFRDCYRYDGEGWRVYGARAFYPAYRYFSAPNYARYAVRSDGCYYEQGYGGFDRGILLVCPRDR